MNREGTIVVIHAHGDNIPLLKHWVPRFTGPVVATTQAPRSPMSTTSGGSRTATGRSLLPTNSGPYPITLVGFDLDDKDVDPVKRGKLHSARKLLAMIGLYGMSATAFILDGYVDEPACLGVPPYISPYIRTVAGALIAHGYTVRYLTIDQLRKDPMRTAELNRAALLVMIAGVTVPGKYLGGTPATLTEIQQVGHMVRGPKKLIGGPIGFGYAGGRRAEGDPAGDQRVRCPAHGRAGDCARQLSRRE